MLPLIHKEDKKSASSAMRNHAVNGDFLFFKQFLLPRLTDPKDL